MRGKKMRQETPPQTIQDARRLTPGDQRENEGAR